MNSIFYIVISMLAMLSITFEELSTKHQAAWNIYHKDIDSAEKLFNDALIEYRSYLDIRREAVALIDMASLYGKKNNPSKRLEYLLRAEKLVERFDDTTIIATLYSNLIVVYSAYNRYDKALRCLKIKRRYISDTDSIQIADYYTKIASLYSDLGDSQKAIDYLRQADAIVPISKEKKGQIYVSYGYYFAELGIPDSALYYYEKAMILYDGWNNKINLQAVLNYYSNKQKYYKNVKIKTIDSLEAIIKEHDLKGDLPQLLALKSHVLKDTIYIHRAIELSQKYRPVFYIEIIKELSDLQFELKNFEESRANLELYHKLKDSVEQYKSGAILDDLSEIGSSVAENDENNTEKFKIYLPLALVIIVSLLAFIIFTKFSTYRRKK